MYRVFPRIAPKHPKSDTKTINPPTNMIMPAGLNWCQSINSSKSPKSDKIPVPIDIKISPTI